MEAPCRSRWTCANEAQIKAMVARAPEPSAGWTPAHQRRGPALGPHPRNAGQAARSGDGRPFGPPSSVQLGRLPAMMRAASWPHYQRGPAARPGDGARPNRLRHLQAGHDHVDARAGGGGAASRHQQPVAEDGDRKPGVDQLGAQHALRHLWRSLDILVDCVCDWRAGADRVDRAGGCSTKISCA